MKTPPRGKSKGTELEGEPGRDPGKAKADPMAALWGMAGMLFGFSFRGLLIILLWTWGWDLFFRPLFEADGTLPDSVLRVGDVLSRVGAAVHLARNAYLQWGASIIEWLAATPAEGEETPPEELNVAEGSPR